MYKKNSSKMVSIAPLTAPDVDTQSLLNAGNIPRMIDALMSNYSFNQEK